MVFLVIVALTLGCSSASHFRGGTISWQHMGSTGNIHEILFSFSLGWLNNSGLLCDSGVAIQDEGKWTLDGSVTSSDFPHSVAIICTSFGIDHQWLYGSNHFKANLTTSGKFNVIFAGGDWMSSLQFGGDSKWSVALVGVDFDTRSDTLEVNHPPSTISSPVIRIKFGCPTTIKINVVDMDDDIISCRYATGNLECAGVCGSFTYFSLNERNCTIRYNGGGGAVTVPVALMLEDHPRQTITLGGSRTITTSHTLSSIPLQFLVEIIISASGSCSTAPTYPMSTIGSNSIIKIPEGESLNKTLVAHSGDPNYRITRFVVIGPIGLTVSDIFSPSVGVYSTIINWLPNQLQAGYHLLCFYAVDSSGQHGEQICSTVAVAVRNPCETDNMGCSDKCVRRRFSSRCECQTACWTLAENRKTCTPNMEVACDGKGVDISVARCASNQTILAGTQVAHFSQKICQFVETGSIYQLNLSLSNCGLEFEPAHLQYALTAWIWVSFDADRLTITRGEWRKIPVTCSLHRTGNLTGSFLPVAPFNDEFFPDEIEVTGMGHFSLYFEHYRTNSFAVSYPPVDYPIRVKINDEMFFSLGAHGRGGLVFFTEQCIAMSNSTIEKSSLVYPFIQDGCLIDPTLVRHVSSHAMENRFSMRAFEFKKKLLVERKDAEIHVQCRIILCDAVDSETRCARGCLSASSREKRSVYQHQTLVGPQSRMKTGEDGGESFPSPTALESPPQGVGTIFILTADSTLSDGNGSSSTSYTTWIVVALSVVILAMASFIGYLVVKNRGRQRKMEDDAATK